MTSFYYCSNYSCQSVTESKILILYFADNKYCYLTNIYFGRHWIFVSKFVIKKLPCVIYTFLAFHEITIQKRNPFDNVPA